MLDSNVTTLYIIVGIVLALGAVLAILQAIGGGEEKAKYRYTGRKFFLTRAEHECYDVLGQAVGHEYRIFAQVHLPTLVDNKVKGQNWKAAFRHINGKSVDFVLCDKEYLSPKLAIELDDKSHERPERQERDREVERILHEAGIPLLRIENRGHFDSQVVAKQIADALK